MVWCYADKQYSIINWVGMRHNLDPLAHLRSQISAVQATKAAVAQANGKLPESTKQGAVAMEVDPPAAGADAAANGKSAKGRKGRVLGSKNGVRKVRNPINPKPYNAMP